MEQRYLGLVAVALSSVVATAAAAAPPSATLYASPGGGVGHDVVEALRTALAARKQIAFEPVETIVGKPSTRGRDALARASRRVERGRTQLANLELDQARENFSAAAALQRRHFHDLGANAARTLADTLGALSTAQLLAGAEEQAKTSLVEGFAVLPGLEYDGKRYPPQMKRLFDEARFLFDALGKGPARVTSKPAGGLVRLNGRAVGFTPLRLRGVAVARNVVSVSKLGYRPRSVRLDVPGAGAAGEVEVELELDPQTLGGSWGEALAEARRGEPEVALVSLAKRLGRDVLLLAELSAAGKAVTVQIYAFDRRAAKLTAEVKATIASSAQVGGVVDTLLAGLRSPGSQVRPPVARASGPSWFTRVRRSRYFWPVVIGVAGAAVVATTVGLAVNAASDSGPDRRLLLLPAPTIGF